MTLTNKQQFVICEMVNADPTYIPEDETAEEKKYREELVAQGDRFEQRHSKRPILEIPIDPWDDDDADEEEEIPSLEDCLAHYKSQDLETLTYCELKEFRKFVIWSGEKELPKKLLERMRYLVKTNQVTDKEMEASAYL
tara:strand:- start:36 stop:452 length:417 start_codon:yes stop_codon:yes gene_type:complete